jgi:integrase
MKIQVQNQHQQQVSNSERLYYNSIKSPCTQHLYRVYLQKYLAFHGMTNVSELNKDHKEVESQIIEFIITSKEKGMKRDAISNYTRAIIAFCKINDIVLNTSKISRFMPSPVKSKKTFAYSHEQIQKMLDIADERMRAVILILSSTGIRIGALPSLSFGSLEEIAQPQAQGDLYKVTVYENEPEEYLVFCTSECKKAITDYLDMRRRYGEVITDSSPLIREQFDKRDQFAIAHPRRIMEPAISTKLKDLAHDAGLRTKTQMVEGQKSAAAGVRKDVPVCNGFRRFFSSQLVNADLNTEKRWLLEGHNLKANDSSYVHISGKELLSQYMTAHDNLLISQEHKLREKVEKLEIEKTEIQALRFELEKVKQAISEKTDIYLDFGGR